MSEHEISLSLKNLGRVFEGSEESGFYVAGDILEVAGF